MDHQKGHCIHTEMKSDSGGIIHVANIKGGVGKSTIATNLAAAFSLHAPTLVIDLDVQGSATHALGLDPGDVRVSSWELFKKPYHAITSSQMEDQSIGDRISSSVSLALSRIGFCGTLQPDMPSLAVKVNTNLSLIPASSDLFKHYTFLHVYNLIGNIRQLRALYKYIIIDTPSVWNSITRHLCIASDLTLIPVTLSALSTRSLRDYLKNVRKLSHDHPSVRIRIIKNEVYGSKDATTAVRGKTRTMQDNRHFLESLCEQAVINTTTGVSLLPQSIIFDLEIPESSMIRAAQDMGMPVHGIRQNSVVAKAFEQLRCNVQQVLNKPAIMGVHSTRLLSNQRIASLGSVATALTMLCIFLFNSPVEMIPSPRPIAPQQLVATKTNIFEYTYNESKSLLKLAKFAICRFSAIVPSNSQVIDYINEVLAIHNMTRTEDQPRIVNASQIPKGTLIKFYPPLKITNEEAQRLVPVYRYFTSVVSDTFAYVTGDWCERGFGGGTPHYGIDVAAMYGAKIYSPISGTIVVQNSVTAGRMVGVVKDHMIIFFAHMDKRFVKHGAYVKRGDAVGSIGMTGITSGPHVHVGYGLETPNASGGSKFGSKYYKLTDPKLFFYREQYMAAQQR